MIRKATCRNCGAENNVWTYRGKRCSKCGSQVYADNQPAKEEKRPRKSRGLKQQELFDQQGRFLVPGDPQPSEEEPQP